MKNTMTYAPINEKFVTAASLKPKTEFKPFVTDTIILNEKQYLHTDANYRSCGVTMDIFKQFAPNADRLIEMFGAERIEKHLDLISMSDLITEEFHPFQRALVYCDRMKGVLVGKPKNGKIKQYKGEWEKEETVYGYDVITPNHRYNNLYEGTIIRHLLISKWPWLNSFNLNVYGLNYNVEYEFYVSFKAPSSQEDGKIYGTMLYVPFEALEKQDSTLIKKRMETYYGNYYRGRKAEYDRVMTVFGIPECQTFLDCVDGNIPEGMPYAKEEPIEEIKVYSKKYGYVLIRVDKGILQIPSTYPDFNSAYEILCNWINTLCVGRDDEVLSVQPYFSKGTIKVNLGTAYEAMIVRVEI